MLSFFFFVVRSNKDKYGRDLETKRERHGEIKTRLPELKKKLEEREGEREIMFLSIGKHTGSILLLRQAEDDP